MHGFPALIVITLVLTCLALPRATAQDASSEKPVRTKQLETRQLPGMRLDGRIQLPTQWTLDPAGKQVTLGDFPVNMTVHPTGDWAAILHTGYGEHEILTVDLKELHVISRAPIPQGFYGLCFDPDGARLFASGGEHEVIHEFRCSPTGYLVKEQEIRIADKKEKLVPAGVRCSADGKTLFVAAAWGHTLVVVDLMDPTRQSRIPLAPNSYPYLAIPEESGDRCFVSLWGASSVAIVDLKRKQVERTLETAAHPTEMLLAAEGELLYVACANSNSVCVFETSSGKQLEIITSSLYPKARPGSTPNSIALSPDERVLAIANADNNNVALVEVSERGRSHSLGYIPVGWYPTSVRFDSPEQRLLVANGKGLISKANRQGPNAAKPVPKNVEEYIGGLFRGTLSVIEAPSPADMARYTRQAYACSPLREDEAPVAKPRSPDNPIPAKLGDPSPIKHCIYIIKENRTYDQVFGDLPQGNGDSALCIFPERITPNHHALVREFVLLDNFYVESEVSADGHEWSMAAYATDFVEKTWPLNYRGGLGKLSYPSEGSFPIAASAGGYIWDRCRDAGVSYRSYGEFIANGTTPEDPGTAKVPGLEGHFDPLFRSYDLDYPDVKRAARFIEELHRFEQEGEFPQFIVMRLPNDHTYGSRVGKHTPTAMVADNDLALGQVVEAISQSRFWKDTAIFVVQDDAQNGSDHVDAHRTVALVISPYTRRGHVDSHLYSTASMLRTMELILGLQPMTQFDAAALPMYDSFQAEPNLNPYQHLPAQVRLDARNGTDAWGAAISEELDFSSEDAADDLVLNDIVWRSVRGAEAPMPAPVRAAFVFTHPEEEDEEDDE